MSIRIILADDHNLVRAALCLLLERDNDIDVVGEVADGQATLQMVRKLRPDIVIMDIAMPGLNGIEATRKITSDMPAVKVIALSAHSDKKNIFHMLKAGASGYLLKDCVFTELAQAIRAVAKNQVYISPAIADLVVEDFLNQPFKKNSSVFSVLTIREREVLQLLSEGRNVKQIAISLKLGLKTIETYRKQIMDKLKIYNVAELTKYAIREGITYL